MRSWLKDFFAHSCAPKFPARRFQPGLENLEDRLTPSTVNLVNPLEAAPPSSHPAKFKATRPKAVTLEMSVVSLSSTKLRLVFDKALGKGANLPTTYNIPGLKVFSVRVSGDRKVVTLTTSPQKKSSYSVRLRGLLAKGGNPVRVSPVTFINYSALLSSSPPRVVGAASTGNRTVMVSFSEPMSDSALSPHSYTIGQANVNTEAGTLRVLSARFLSLERRAVELTTDSQNELTYTVTAVNVADMAGRSLAPRTFLQTTVVDPTQANFRGTPPGGASLIDSDGDGLSDNEEQRGWTASFKLLNGTVVTRSVTSDPFNPDTDGDSFTDAAEAALRLDPRDPDTDDDLIGDNQEFNEIFSDPANQDTDGDGLDDGLEFHFFKTAPTQADTDGDQLPDGEEVLLANRNARVADLPTPAIEIGATSLRLDVRFVETTSSGTRTLDSKSATSTLVQSESRSFSNSNSNTQEAFARIANETEVSIGTGLFGGVDAEFSTKVTVESGWTGTWTTTNTQESTRETQRAFEETLSSEVEGTRGASLERQVFGAQMQATVHVKNASNLAYRIQNLQLTAFIQDPQDPTKLTPVATLLPDNEPENGFTLGPLVPERGPLVFSNSTIFPSLVESLMQNPRGLVYKIANFDITDELGRNFAFTSRDVTERTGSLVIDFGGFDSDADGEGDLTEYHRVATSSGRVIDGHGHPVVFDGDGKQVGITLREALAAIGLKEYDETTTPTSSLTDEQVRTSYSIEITPEGLERVFRVRDVAIEEGVRKAWVVLTPTGIAPDLGLDNTILRPDSDVKLAFVQDLDSDLVPANVEAMLGTSDVLKDTDGDSLDDRFEALLGWKVDLAAKGMRRVFSSGTMKDSDRDGLSDDQEAPANLIDSNGDGIIDRAEKAGPDDFVTDPLSPDTDRDGVDDASEINGYSVTLRANGSTITVETDPTNFDTDGDTAADGLERRLGGNPTDPSDRDFFADDDRDGLTNVEETDGWTIKVRSSSLSSFQQGPERQVAVQSDPHKADTDGDGLSDGEEFDLGTDPRADLRRADGSVSLVRGTDTDQDGLTDFEEVRGLEVRDLGIMTLNPIDADFDNDQLPDGFEAKGLILDPWIVRVEGKDPYQVFSDPRKADADFDGLADGDEYNWFFLQNGPFRVSSDPTMSNTDADRRNDYQEYRTHITAPNSPLSPLVDDFLVTVYYSALSIQDDWSTGDNAGDFAFDFALRLPDSTRAIGLSADLHHVVVETQMLTGPFQVVDTTRQDVEPRLPFLGDWWDDEANMTQTGFFGISIQDNSTLMLPGILPEAQRSVTFAMTKNQRFAFEGVVVVERFLPFEGVVRRYIHFGGLDGIPAGGEAGSTRLGGVFEGSELATLTIKEVSFHFDLTNGEGSDGFGPSGTVYARYVVT